MRDTAGTVGYKGPPRKAEDVIAAALADEEFMRQLRESLDEERRGIPPMPFRRILEEEARRRRTT